MAVHDPVYVGAGAINLGMEKTLPANRTPFIAHRLAIKIELHNVRSHDETRRARSRHQEPVGIARMAATHVAVSIGDALVV
jgi:hypothetical protein